MWPLEVETRGTYASPSSSESLDFLPVFLLAFVANLPGAGRSGDPELDLLAFAAGALSSSSDEASPARARSSSSMSSISDMLTVD